MRGANIENAKLIQSVGFEKTAVVPWEARTRLRFNECSSFIFGCFRLNTLGTVEGGLIKRDTFILINV